MRIGVLTHLRSEDNYGQILQAFALQKYLISKGHYAYLIQYYSDNNKSNKYLSFIRRCIRRIIGALSKSRREAYEKVLFYQKLSKKNSIKNKARKFLEFKSENLNLSKVYTSYHELQIEAPEADAYIVGSDQVWNPSLHNPNTAAWYLKFGKATTKRISYAASIGRVISKSEENTFVDYLHSLDAISLREKNAFDYCLHLEFDNCRLVVDPTVLTQFSIYESFIDKNAKPQKPYIFLYYLNVQNKEELAWKQLNSFISKQKLSLKSVSSSGYYPAQSLIPGNEDELLTIPEWLTAIYHSQYVVTTSFHGMVFAILMHKPFVIIPLTNQYKSGNGRIESLLMNIGLEDRLLSNKNNMDDIFAKEIDWDEVDNKLLEMRLASEQFLEQALK